MHAPSKALHHTMGCCQAKSAALCRPPGEQELMLHLQYIEEAENSREALEDTLWIVLNKSEFLFQH